MKPYLIGLLISLMTGVVCGHINMKDSETLIMCMGMPWGVGLMMKDEK